MDTALKLYKILLIKGINVNTANPISHGETNNIPILCQIIYLLPNNSLLEYVLPVLSHTPDLNN